jgi:cytochrome bd-type quinol oxidase subunit 1
MDLDPVLLSRLQFAWVIGCHILLPTFTRPVTRCSPSRIAM